ncbi:MAG: PHP domain-containing protein [Dehalococcoidia bacterium]
MATGDFHLHSTASDGVQSPTWVMETAAANGVRVLSLTDHDTTEGQAEAQAAAGRLGLRLIPGIELSTDVGKSDVHLLVFGFDLGNARFQEYLTWLRDARLGRAARIVEILAEQGAPVALQRVLEIAGDATVGRPHIARALLEAGHITNIQEAFDRWLADGQPADVPRPKMSPKQAIDEAHAAGGAVFIAHPVFIGAHHPEVVAELAGYGLDGIETFYKHYTPEQVASHVAMASEHGLARSGGSDFHGLGKPDDRAIGDIPLASEDVDAFVAFLDGRGVDTGRRSK